MPDESSNITHLMCHMKNRISVLSEPLPSLDDLFLFFWFVFFRARPAACGSSQARGRIRAAAASLCHSHSNPGFELHLRLTPKLIATTGSYPTE